MNLAKKIVRVVVIVLLSIISLNIMLFLTFTIPAVQKHAANFAIDKLKQKLKTEIQIDKLRIKFFNSVQINGIYVEDLQRDTLFYAKKLSASINIQDLMNNQLSIKSVNLHNFTACVNRDSTNSPFNFQFIIDAFAPTDTTPKPVKEPLKISIRGIKLENGTLKYDILSQPESPGAFNTNHFSVKNFNLKADIPSLDMQKLRAEIRSLSFDEVSSGIKVEKLEGQFRSKKSKFWAKKLNLIFNNSTINIRDASFDTANKKFEAKLKSEMIDPADVSIFAGMIDHLEKPISLETEVTGEIPQAEIKKFELEYGDQTRINLIGQISDFLKIDETDIDISINELKTSVSDLEDFIRIGAEDFESVSQLSALKNFDLTLSAKGKISDFSIVSDIKTVSGNISFKGKGSMREQFSDLAFSGRIVSENLKVAQIIGDSIGVDKLFIDTQGGVEIKRDRPVKAYADGKIHSVNYKNYTYHNLSVKGNYMGNEINGRVISDTEENKFDLTADLSFGDLMKFDINAIVDKLNITPLFSMKQWENPYLITRIDANLEGSSFDNMVGLVVIDSTSLYDDKFVFNPGPIYLQAQSDETGRDKKIEIFTSVLEGEISGDYHFSTISDELKSALHVHLPTVINESNRKIKDGDTSQFKFNFLLKNTEILSYALSLPFINVDPAKIEGSVDMQNSKTIWLNGYIPRMMMNQNDIRETKFSYNSNDNLGMNLNLSSYLVQENGHINAKLNTTAFNDSVTNDINLNVDNNLTQVDGNLNISMGFYNDLNNDLASNISVNPTNLFLNGKTIDVIPSSIIYEKDKITVKNFELREEKMLLLGVDGIASKEMNDSIHIFFNNTDLETILAAVKISNFKGSINGGVLINQALTEPMIRTDNFRIENIHTLTDTLGTLIVEGNWDLARNGLTVDADLKNRGNNYFCIEGFVPLGGNDPLDVDVSVTRMPLKWVNSFAVSAFSSLSGTIDSKIKISGKLDAPQTNGWLGINDGKMTIAYTNVTYKISDTITITPEKIGLNNLIITDNNNHRALLNLSLEHSNFDGMNYKISLQLDDFLLLNNERRVDEIAYGDLKLSGNINLNGSSSGIFGTAMLKNESRSKIMIELPQTAQATEYSGIIYINTPQLEDSLSFLRKRPNNTESALNTRLSSGMPINIQAFIDINPQLETGVEINPITGDALEIRGRGQIRANIDTRSEPMVRLYGDYVAESGKFHYSFQKLKSIDFNIRNGSTVTLVGDPLSTQFNIVAYNQVNADLATLSESFTTEVVSSRIPVNARLDISGNLNQMNLDYGIELPDASSDIRQRLNSLISTDEQKNKQFASLILTGGFMSSEGLDVGGMNNNMATSLAFGQLAKGLDAIFASTFDDNWSINTNLKSTDGTFDNMRMGVDVSTRLFNDKLRLTTNLSYGDNSTFASQQAFMGEFELEYDLSNWLMLRAYNRANQRFSKRAPTTQGAGVVVTKNSQRFRDLFKFSFRKKDEGK